MVPSSWRGLSMANIIITAASLLAILVKQSISQPFDVLSNPFHASWTDKATRYDFIFHLVSPLTNSSNVESISRGSLVSCVGFSACLLKNGTFLQAYKEHQLVESTKPHRLVFTSVDNKPLNASASSPQNLTIDRGTISIYHYCSTHWTPPIHVIGDSSRNHTFDWHSPYGCHQDITTYEHPCYTYDTNGQLIDLTRWVLSNGSSYSVDTGKFNTTIKKFNLNVCNEAHDTCGPNISSCYTDSKGHVESGYNNITSLKYNSKDRAAILTTMGQFNHLCPDQRVKTVVRFLCKDKIVMDTRPKLVSATACESTIEWPTVYACPISDIRQPATNCAIKNEALGIDINLRQVIKNATSIEVPHITINGTEKKMILGLCKGINATTLKCEGKATSTTSACLLDSDANTQNSSNSQIMGSITNSYIRLTDNRVYLESFAPNKTCQISTSRNLNFTNRVGTRVEFFCSSKADDKPVYAGYEDCVHIFEWGTPLMCFETMAKGAIDTMVIENSTSKAAVILANNTTPLTQNRPSDEELKINLDSKPQTAQEMHQKTLEDTKKTSFEPTKINSPTMQNKEKTTPLVDNKMVNEKKVSTAAQNVDRSKLDLQPVPETKMNKWHKFFMISLIVVSLAGFIVFMFILDNKTRLGIPLSNLRRQARQAFQPQPVPYSRVDNFNDHLDL